MKRSRPEVVSEKVKCGNPTQEIRYVDFYAGVGGWSMALNQAARVVSPSHFTLHCCAALDHSDLCLKVYRENFQSSNTTKRIQDLTTKECIEWNAHIWLMSPPCQPHTRQHSNQEHDIKDPRSQSFLHLCSLLEKLPADNRPAAIVLENVDGFQHSKSAQRFFSVLSLDGQGDDSYRVGHFLLQPTQVGIPNDRPRYFCIAVLKSRITRNDDPLCQYLSEVTNERELILHTALNELDIVEPPNDQEKDEQNGPSSVKPISDFLDSSNNIDDQDESQLRIPEKLLEKNAAWCFDIVRKQSRRSACFTSGYGKFVRGTGSILYSAGLGCGSGANETSSTIPSPLTLQSPEDRSFDANWAEGLDLKQLRYFSGTEMARLFGFEDFFRFPSDTTLKQQWKLVGNSLNVKLASRLLQLVLKVAFLAPSPASVSDSRTRL